MDHREHDEGQEVLYAEDEDGEGVLHVGVGPHLHTHVVLGPGKVHSLNSLRLSIRSGKRTSWAEQSHTQNFLLEPFAYF